MKIRVIKEVLLIFICIQILLNGLNLFADGNESKIERIKYLISSYRPGTAPDVFVLGMEYYFPWTQIDMIINEYEQYIDKLTRTGDIDRVRFDIRIKEGFKILRREKERKNGVIIKKFNVAILKEASKVWYIKPQ